MKTFTKLTITLALLFFVGKTFAQVGINASGAAPSANAMLDVSSTTKGALLPRMTTAQRTTLAATATAGLTVFDTDTQSYWFFKSPGGWAELAAGGASPWSISGTTIYNTNTGNVGIGTSTTQAKLNIQSSRSDPAIPSSSSLGGLLRIGISANEGIDFGKAINPPFSSWMQAGFNGTQVDPISLNPLGGNVGIGILNPTNKLHIANNANSIITNEITAGTEASLELKTTNGIFDFLELRKWASAAGGSIGTIPLAGLSTITTGMHSTGGLLIGTKPAQPLYFTTDNIERMRISESGNVGIGTVAPTGKLMIESAGATSSTSSSIDPQIRLKLTNDFNYGWTRFENSNGTRHFSQRYDLLSVSSNLNSYSLYYGSDQLFNVRGDGKFGLNVNAPSDLLHLSPISNTGDVYARISSTSGLTGLRLQNLAGDWTMYSNEFSKLFLGYSTNNFVSTAEVITMEPTATEYNFKPSTTNQVYLGTSANRWREIWSVNNLNTSSDRRLKKNITDLNYGLDEVMKLKAVSYNWKNNLDSKLHLGFIAQDVDKIIPEIVSKSSLSDLEFEKLQQKGELPTDTYGMEYTGLIPVLVKAMQEQQRIIESKSQQISQLEARLTAIEASLNPKPSQIYSGK